MKLKTNRSRASKFKFFAFLDLISCAFGAAILIFVVSAVTTEEETVDDDVSESTIVLVARHAGDQCPEIEFEITCPDGSRSISSESNIEGLVKFAAPAESHGGSLLVIPNPSPGIWRFRIFWTDGIGSSIARFDVQSLCVSGIPKQQQMWTDVSLSSVDRFSKEMVVQIVDLSK